MVPASATGSSPGCSLAELYELFPCALMQRRVRAAPAVGNAGNGGDAFGGNAAIEQHRADLFEDFVALVRYQLRQVLERDGPVVEKALSEFAVSAK